MNAFQCLISVALALFGPLWWLWAMVDGGSYNFKRLGVRLNAAKRLDVF
jgi:hypothetical protein